MATRNDILTRMQEILKEADVTASKDECGKSLNAALNAVADIAEQHGSINTVIGTFRTARRNPRENGRNPKTGETIAIKGSTRLAFTPGKSRVKRDGEEATTSAAPAKKVVKKLTAKK